MVCARAIFSALLWVSVLTRTNGATVTSPLDVKATTSPKAEAENTTANSELTTVTPSEQSASRINTTSSTSDDEDLTSSTSLSRDGSSQGLQSLLKSEEKFSNSTHSLTHGSDLPTESADDATTNVGNVRKRDGDVIRPGEDVTKSDEDMTKPGEDVTKSNGDMTKSKEDATKSDEGVPNLTSAVEDGSSRRENTLLGGGQRGKLFLGAFTTVSHTVVTFLTSTVPLTCINSLKTSTICGGRRKSFRKIILDDLGLDSEGLDLSPSSRSPYSEVWALSDELDPHATPKGRAFYTVWVRSTVTTTLTTYSTNTATTVSLSYNCSAGGIDVPSTACG